MHVVLCNALGSEQTMLSNLCCAHLALKDVADWEL